jgi:hypothetical protein
MGYLRLSIAVLGPNDKLAKHDVAKEKQKEAEQEKQGKTLADLVMMPPQVKQSVHFLVATIYEAEHLPNMDASAFGAVASAFGKRGGIDAFVRVDFAGNPKIKTKTITKKMKKGEVKMGMTDLNPEFNEQLWLPVTLSGGKTMSNRIAVTVWDHDLAGADDRVATASVKFRDVQHGPWARPPRHVTRSRGGGSSDDVHMIGGGPRWYNLYGAPSMGDTLPMSKERRAKDKMTLHPDLASTWRGRMLMSLHWDQNKNETEPEKVHSKKVRKLKDVKMPKKVKYLLKTQVFAGSELPTIAKPLFPPSPLSIIVTCGEIELSTDFVKPRGGFVEWDGDGGGNGSGTTLNHEDMEFSDDLMEKWADANTRILLEVYRDANEFKKALDELTEDTSFRWISGRDERTEHKMGKLHWMRDKVNKWKGEDKPKLERAIKNELASTHPKEHKEAGMFKYPEYEGGESNDGMVVNPGERGKLRTDYEQLNVREAP